MLRGMSYEEYWYGDVWAIEAFRQKDELEQQRRNSEMWLQGMYFYEALGDVAPILQAFAKRGTRAKPYAKKPYQIGARPKQADDRPPTKQEIENERLKGELFFRNWARATAKHFKQGKT